MSDTRDTFIRSLNRELYRQLRVAAVAQGLTVGEAMNQAIALWLVREAQEGRLAGDASMRTDASR